MKGEPRRFIQGHNPKRGTQAAPEVRRATVASRATDAELIVPRTPTLTDDDTTGRYLEQLAALAEQFAGVVRDEGPDAVAVLYRAALAVPAAPGVDRQLAFAVCLAAQIDVDAPRSARLGWVAALGGGPVPAGASPRPPASHEETAA